MVRHAVTAWDVKPLSSNHMTLQLTLVTPEVRHALTKAVAQELHKIHGGNAMLDWLEAEILVEDVLEQGPAESTMTDVAKPQ